jgi:acyl-ACP thioesterase
MGESVWKERFHIRTHEADMNGSARLDAMFSCFQEAAGHHAGDLGVGRVDLERQGCHWVLSRGWMKIDRYPAWGQTFFVHTWPCGVERAFALRDFEFLSEAGERLGSGVSAWLIVHREKALPMRPKRFMQHVPPTRASAAPGEVLAKQPAPHNLSDLRSLAVRYSDLDVNRHVNNAVYVRWILDSFDARWHDRFRIAAIRIDYISETVLGEKVLIRARELGPNGEQLIVGVRPGLNQPVFQAGVVWRPSSAAGD